MAKIKQQQQQQPQQQQQHQQLLMIYLTLCLINVTLITEVQSVSVSSIQFDGSGNMLQQQESQLTDNNLQEHNYILGEGKQTSPTVVPNNLDILEDEEDVWKENRMKDDMPNDILNLGLPFQPFTLNKRAPGGFVGMRGKKLYNDEENNNVHIEDTVYTLPWSQLKNVDESNDSNDYIKAHVGRYKKASTAFYGVRGKKFTAMNGVHNNDDNQRWHDFLWKLEEERARETALKDFVERLVGSKNDVTNDMAKRAPIGFTGVRGKRPVLDEFAYPFEPFNKRGLGNNAFVGVRGKKDVTHQTVKRSPAAGSESLPGRNGKRQRFVDLNNKFVAVRGKKSSYDDILTFNAIDDNGSPTTALTHLYGKRAPNGFLDMRGKHPSTTDNV